MKIFFENIFEASKDAIGYAAIDGTILLINRAFSELTGFSREELLRMNVRDLIPEHHKNQRDRVVAQVLQTGEPGVREWDHRQSARRGWPRAWPGWPECSGNTLQGGAAGTTGPGPGDQALRTRRSAARQVRGRTDRSRVGWTSGSTHALGSRAAKGRCSGAASGAG